MLLYFINLACNIPNHPKVVLAVQLVFAKGNSLITKSRQPVQVSLVLVLNQVHQQQGGLGRIFRVSDGKAYTYFICSGGGCSHFTPNYCPICFQVAISFIPVTVTGELVLDLSGWFCRFCWFEDRRFWRKIIWEDYCKEKQFVTKENRRDIGWADTLAIDRTARAMLYKVELSAYPTDW